ncbi:MAG TPA: AAA family ATPase [Candidatus Sulfotelmatobacter sp.]|nr:AAA family ATPase [Candidatus Sulfotelmatobacter sp.]
MPTLIYKFQNEERRVALNDRLTIGRADDNDLRLQCDSVSSHHAIIARDGGRFQLTDAGSRYGIFADGQQVSRLDLQEGATFALGDVEFVFSAKDGAANDTAAAPPPPAAAPEPDPLAEIAAFKSAHDKILAEIGKVIVGQRTALKQMLVALFARGHCLLIGVPGLAKTLMVKTMGNAVDLKARRIQFTPDLMPSDITGTDILEEDAATGKRVFQFHRGPIFTNLLLADEINRTPPKTQAALLEAMQEHRVTISGATYDLPDPFMVLATQNPIEQEGTYPLPEAQLDRFMFCVHLGYPSVPEELQVISETTRNVEAAVAAALNAAGVLKLQHLVRQVPVSQHVAQYALNLIRATRPNAEGAPDFVNRWVRWGAGTRAGQYLLLAAKAHVLLEGRFSVSCADVREYALPVLRHRIFPNFTAASESVTTDQIVKKLVEAVKEPKY